MVETEEKTTKDWLKIILPRVLRATVWGLIWGVLLLFPFEQIIAGYNVSIILPAETTLIYYYFYMLIGIEIVIQLLHGTIFQHILSVVRGFITIIFLIIITDGGIFSFATSSMEQLPLPPGLSAQFTIDFRVVLAGFLIFSLLGIARNLIHTIDFLAEEAEEPMIPPELP